MAPIHALIFVTLITYTLCLPLAKNGEIQAISDSSVTESSVVASGDTLVNLDLIKSRIKRSKECGVMCGNMCPEGSYKVDSGFCLPCQSGIPECGGVSVKDDYDDN